MSYQQKKSTSFGEVFVVLLLIFCILADLLFIYYKYFMPKTYTEDVAYIGAITDVNENKKQVFEVNYYANKDNSGVELLEIRTNFFTDYKKQETYSSGVQYVGKPKFETINLYDMNFLYRTNKNQLYVKDNVYFYNTDNNTNISYERAERINNDDCFTIEIADKVYKLGFNSYVYDSGFAHTSYIVHNIYSFSQYIYTGIQSMGVVNTSVEFEFKDVFNLMLWNDNQGKYVDVTDADVFKSYVYISINTHSEGAKSVNDSIFKCVSGNANWVNEGTDLTKEYATNETYYLLTKDNLEFKFDNDKNYHIATINEETYTNFKDSKINFKLLIDNDYLKNNSIVFGELDSLYLNELNIDNYYVLNNGVISEVAVC